jgi:hypothetical protein
MKKIIKITSLFLSMICLFAIPALANEIDYTPQPYYNFFTGTVEEVTKVDDVTTKIYLKNKDDLEAYFILSENTYYADGVKIEKGLEITGYYESGKPMIMIYPPQYAIDIITPVYKEKFVKVDKFDSNLLSKDKQLKLNISEKTEIVWENNTQIYWFAKPTIEDLETVLGNRQMIVYYDFTTKSLPAQTTPSKIIVLSQQVEDKINIIVEDVIIDAPNAYINDAGNVMVPVRAISEAFGHEVSWNNDEKSVQIGSDISFKISETNYSSAGTLVTLEEASVIKDSRTFVPLSFFKEVMKINVVSYLDDNIILHSGRPITE